MFWIGVAVGMFYVVSIILAFAVGYGWKNQQTKQEEEL